ncbi:MAG: PadR family transcriptional regulator [Phycisphaerales bacterium]|jgi:PadR family transcriptional regulator PadR
MIERELMRGAGPIAVLKLLERREMYGYEIAEALSQRTDGVLAMGQSTLYPLLYNLEAKGLLASRWDDSGSRGRKYYALTTSGKRRLSEDAKQWQAAVDAMRALGVVASTRGVTAMVRAILGHGAGCAPVGARVA